MYDYKAFAGLLITRQNNDKQSGEIYINCIVVCHDMERA